MRLELRPGIHGRGKHQCHDFAVAGALQSAATLEQHFTKLERVRQVAVMRNAQWSINGFDQKRLRVPQQTRACGAITVVTNRVRTD